MLFVLSLVAILIVISWVANYSSILARNYDNVFRDERTLSCASNFIKHDIKRWWNLHVKLGKTFSCVLFKFFEFPLPEDSGKFESLIKTPAKWLLGHIWVAMNFVSELRGLENSFPRYIAWAIIQPPKYLCSALFFIFQQRLTGWLW